MKYIISCVVAKFKIKNFKSVINMCICKAQFKSFPKITLGA